jgi:DNA repair protein RadD
VPWAYWSSRELQIELERLAPKLLDRLEALLPALAPHLLPQEGLDHLFSRTMLTRALRSFAPEDVFESIEYRRRCLDRLPPAELQRLARGLGASGRSFGELRDAIAEVSWSSPEAQEVFLKFFGLPERFWPAEPADEAPFEDVVRAPDAERPTRPLFPYQAAVLASAEDQLASPRSRLLIQMPTGSGKTRTVMALVSRFLTAAGGSPVVFWLAQSEELCAQAFATFTDRWRVEGNRSVRAARVWGRHGLPISVDRPMFVVGGFQKLNSLIASEQKWLLQALRSRTALVVVDEAHRSVAPTYKRVIDYLTAQGAKLIGLSATPGRADEAGQKELVRLYFGAIVEIPRGEATSVVKYLQAQGILSRVSLEPIVTNNAYKLTRAERRYLEEHLDFPPDFLDRVGDDDIRNAEILSRMLVETRRGRRIIYFGCNVAHSQFIADVLSFVGVEAAHVDAATSEHARRSIITRFRAGELHVICNYSVLSTGFDAPNADTVVIARPTRSAVLYSQMVGRGLRGPAMGGGEVCHLMDVRDNIEGLGSVDLLFSEFADLWPDRQMDGETM